MNDEIVTRIQMLMNHYNLSVSALADTIGVQRSSISHLLNGRNKPSLDFIMKLVQAYPEVNLHWLLRGEGSFPATKNIPPAAPPRVPYPKEEEELLPQRKLSRVPPAASGTKQPVRMILLYADGTFESFELKKE